MVDTSAGEHGHENVEDTLAIGDGKDVRRVRAGERRLAHVVHLLVGDAVAGQIRAVHGRLHIQRAVLHVEHERHDLRIVCFGQSQSMHSGVVVEITEILQQIERINTGQQVERRHKKYLSRQLTRTGNMIAFDKMLEDLYREEPRQATEYLSQLGGVIVYLTIRYGRKDRIEAAYFPYIIKKYRLIENRPFSGVVDAMYTLLRESSIYCRENAMQALYTTGDCDCIMKALKILDGGESFFHEKLLTDGLLEFTGDHEALGRCIEKSFADFSPEMQVAMMNFLRLDSGEHCAFALALLQNTATDDEVRYACIRYLGRYPYGPAYETLLDLAECRNDARWEYAAIASTALCAYPGDETIERLKRNLYSRNWYIRFNASKSLERMGLTYLDLIDVMEGHDRYATEILRYRFDIRNLTQKEAEQECTS